LKQSLSIAEWDARFQQQAEWTRELRRNLYSQAGIANARSILEVGCGTGVITSGLRHYSSGIIVGLDLDLNRLGFARRRDPQTAYVGGDALSLPFPDQSFQITLCHFLLLWVPDARRAVHEMRRVTRPGGLVMALAEPDYAGRIDHPPVLADLGNLQAQSLARQGANPNQGRALGTLFVDAGLQSVQTGVLGGQWNVPASPETWEAEWRVLETDLQGLVARETLNRLRRIDQAAWQHGERILFVPTFYAVGKV
jgi:SAM-dependent methyltransferase